MLFNSWQYAIFLPVVFALYWALPHRLRWPLLLAASYYFYMSWNVKYVVLILFTTAVSYAAALLLEKTPQEKKRRLLLTAALIACLGVLFVFKYWDFFFGSLAALMRRFAIPLHPATLRLLLPVGISFYTFQTLGYVIDVYRGDAEAEKNFGVYATFISFFPQLVAGPIERTKNLLPQIRAEHAFDYDQATYGLKLMAWGYFKKIVIADTLSRYVSVVYDAPQGFRGFALVLATAFFTIQIYCDFSGYSDIAVGTAKLLGVDLMTNFKSPYFSASAREFWSRWHISLSTWFRDYVYIPLGGNRVGKARHALNLMVTFLVSGLWHGANWTFVVWGGLHGAAQVLENALIPKKAEKSTGVLWWIRVLIVFAFVSFAWIFFVSNSIGDAVYVIGHLFDNIQRPANYLYAGFANIGMTSEVELAKTAFLVAVLGIFDFFSLKTDVISELGRKKIAVRWTAYICLGLIVVFFSKKDVAAEFVYFQF